VETQPDNLDFPLQGLKLRVPVAKMISLPVPPRSPWCGRIMATWSKFSRTSVPSVVVHLIQLAIVLSPDSGLVAAVIVGGRPPNFPVAASAFLVTGAFLFLSTLAQLAPVGASIGWRRQLKAPELQGEQHEAPLAVFLVLNNTLMLVARGFCCV
jgi:hypothetical protein